jgi:ribonuclease G
MPKELIVSVNGREKKIAIIEDGRTTEFYIERGEGNHGIVGNIYKGRVMRVLPGMQSAFVDIGLERDAFLYVSDFFDEEEEFERIVLDKSKKGDAAGAERAAKEQIEQARIDREQRIESTQERAEPLMEVEPAVLREVTAVEESTEVEEEVVDQPAAASVETADQSREADGGRRRGRRGRRRGRGFEDQQQETRTQPVVRDEAPRSDIDTPFAVAGDSFQRVVDEEAAEDGAMFKDARVQEKILDQIHAVEFELEDVPTAQVGSLLSNEFPTGGSFQRVDDSEFAGLEQPAAARLHEAIEAHVGAFVDEVKNEMVARSFERVSDDAENENAEATTATEPVAERPGRRSRSRRGKKDGSAETGAELTEAAAEPVSADAIAEAPEEPKAKRGKSAKPAKEGARKTATKKPANKPRSRRAAATGTEATAPLEPEEPAATADEAADGESYADGDARITTGRERAEFATRRGGRRRRRGGKPEGPGSDGDAANGKADEGPVQAEIVDGPPVPVSAVAAPLAPPRRDRPQGGDNRGHRGGSGGGGGQRRNDRQQPTITDLLREGQEILVQIAKEPIAKKGARITSHIALPGRFLVYMPTVEHVGVSRKIESDSERQRLRKLIQAIRAEEDVPSGGFIVRTAGTGISDEDLRDDARYLVRTWLDIRKDAEKTRPATVVHQDLDLVERLLRDQLSEDYTAIRVDSEEEYLRIVEFINRIQPRMVKRVKLYTRDEPILEAYGVQAEIDKAIKPRVWLKSGGYLVINQTEALVAIDVNTGKFVGRGGTRLEDTITRTNLEAVDEIVRQIRLRDLGGIIVLDLIDMEDRRNRNRVMQALQEALQHDKSPTKVLSFNDFGLVIMTRKRVKQSLERTLCSPCPYCQGAGLVKSPQTVCYEILDEARRLGKGMENDGIKQTTLRVNPEVGRALRSTERDVLTEIEDYLGPVDLTTEQSIHQEQFDFAFI